MDFLTHLTCPVSRSGGHRFSSPAWSRTLAGIYDMASSDHSGRRGTRPGHHGTGSRRRQTLPHGLPQSGLCQDNQLWGPERSGYVCYHYILCSEVNISHPFSSIYITVVVYLCYLVDSRKTHAEVLAGSLNWFISLSLSEVVVLPSNPSRHHTTNGELQQGFQ